MVSLVPDTAKGKNTARGRARRPDPAGRSAAETLHLMIRWPLPVSTASGTPGAIRGHLGQALDTVAGRPPWHRPALWKSSTEGLENIFMGMLMIAAGMQVGMAVEGDAARHVDPAAGHAMEHGAGGREPLAGIEKTRFSGCILCRVPIQCPGQRAAKAAFPRRGPDGVTMKGRTPGWCCP